MHQGSPFRIGRDGKRLGVDELPGVVDETNAQIGKAMPFFLAIGKFLQENGHVIIRVRMRIATGARPEQDHALDLIAIDLIQRRAETRQDRITR